MLCAAFILDDKRAVRLYINSLAGEGGGLFNTLLIDGNILAEGGEVALPSLVTFGGCERQPFCHPLAEMHQ
jgi:hypothetical protein